MNMNEYMIIAIATQCNAHNSAQNVIQPFLNKGSTKGFFKLNLLSLFSLFFFFFIADCFELKYLFNFMRNKIKKRKKKKRIYN